MGCIGGEGDAGAGLGVDMNQPFFIEDYIRRVCEITHDCRPDMHEPDEQGLSVEYEDGFGLDNACMGPPESEPLRKTDAGFWLVRDKGGADGAAGVV